GEVGGVVDGGEGGGEVAEGGVVAFAEVGEGAEVWVEGAEEGVGGLAPVSARRDEHATAGGAVTEVGGGGAEGGFLYERERVVAVAQGDAEGVGEGGEDAVAEEAVFGFGAVGVGVDGEGDGAGGAGEDGDGVGGAVGAEFPQGGAVAFVGAVGGEDGELAGADVGGVVVAVDVAGDEVEKGFGVVVEEAGAEAEAGGGFCGGGEGGGGEGV